MSELRQSPAETEKTGPQKTSPTTLTSPLLLPLLLPHELGPLPIPTHAN